MKKIVFILTLFFLLADKNSYSQTITIGTGTTTNTATTYPAVYGNYYYGARHQFVIHASEITAAGVTGPKYLNSLSFNVASPSGHALSGFEIKVGNSTFSAFPSTAITAVFQTGLTSVFGPTTYTESAGWNNHPFNAPFYWDGTSNIIVEVCFNNTSFTTNATMFYSTVSFYDCAYRYQDASGNCTKTVMSVSQKRLNMQLEFISPTPPVSSFISADSIWKNISYQFINTSTHFTSCYWNIKNITASRFCNVYGCFMDSSTNFTNIFTDTGTYEVELLVKGFFGVDSIKTSVHVYKVYRPPIANFYVSSTVISTPRQLFFYDSSLYGVSSWSWSMSPYCYTCGYNPFAFPNTFSPSANVQNPNMYVFDYGVFDVCLKVTNDMGSDSICKKSYLTVFPGYNMCNGNDSFSNQPAGYIYDEAGPDQNYQVGLTGQCLAGFVISPQTCADTITLYVDQFRLRATDTLQIRDGSTATSPIIKKLTGSNLAASNKIMYAKSGRMYLRMTTGSGAMTAGDTGFIVHWSVTSGNHLYAAKNYLCPGDSIKLYTTKVQNATYSWKYNVLSLNNYTDTFCYAKYQGTYYLYVNSYACSDSAQISIQAYNKVNAAFSLNNNLQCANTNLFMMADTSFANNMKYNRLWNFGDNTSKADDSVTTKTYKYTGTYPISLKVITTNGCIDSTIKYVRVVAIPNSQIKFGTPNNVCNYDSVQLVSSELNQKQYTWYYNSLPIQDTTSIFWAKAAGYYSLTTINNAGCDSTSSPVIVTFKKPASTPVISRVGNLLSSNSAQGNQWYFYDTAIAGATNPNYIPIQKGRYSLSVDSIGCTYFSNEYQFNFLGINSQLSNAINFRFYPNPANTELKFNAGNLSGETQIDLIDILGNTIFSKTFFSEINSTESFDVSPFARGVYFIRTKNSDQIFFSKITLR